MKSAILNKLKVIRIAKYLFIYLVAFNSLLSCSKKADFNGNQESINLANNMYNAIGGKNAWCDLQSLYIKAEHTEPQMLMPYQSEIWRDVDKFDMVIEQKNDSFHVKGVINQESGTIRYYDKRDTFRTLSPDQLLDWEFGHRHNVYVVLHNMACNPQYYTVDLDENEQLNFYKDSVFVSGFGLDEELRPHLFYYPNPDGTVSGSIFTHWETDNKLVHSAGGHPLDSNFIYRTEIWKPSNKPLKESFGEEIYDID